MATLRANLTTIRTAIYGKQVRKAIADALEQAVDSRYIDIEDFFDGELSTSSKNAVQNKVVTTAINGLKSRVTALETTVNAFNLTDITESIYTRPHQSQFDGPGKATSAQDAHLLGVSTRFDFKTNSAQSTWVDFYCHGRFLMVCTDTTNANAVALYLLALRKDPAVDNDYLCDMFYLCGAQNLLDPSGITPSFTPGDNPFVTVEFAWGSTPRDTEVYFIPLAASNSMA